MVEQWGGTRYLDNATNALKERRQAQEQETPERGRGGPGLSLDTPMEVSGLGGG